MKNLLTAIYLEAMYQNTYMHYSCAYVGIDSDGREEDEMFTITRSMWFHVEN